MNLHSSWLSLVFQQSLKCTFFEFQCLIENKNQENSIFDFLSTNRKYLQQVRGNKGLRFMHFPEKYPEDLPPTKFKPMKVITIASQLLVAWNFTEVVELILLIFCGKRTGTSDFVVAWKRDHWFSFQSCGSASQLAPAKENHLRTEAELKKSLFVHYDT